ncbi:hypothetical protein C8Q72DRAFT_160533 [Fomitopsis betulina]|nr:hypothetical protein C8Q72DRAFT_160533 [Fomitopsis betulina]
MRPWRNHDHDVAIPPQCPRSIFAVYPCSRQEQGRLSRQPMATAQFASPSRATYYMCDGGAHSTHSAANTSRTVPECDFPPSAKVGFLCCPCAVAQHRPRAPAPNSMRSAAHATDDHRQHNAVHEFDFRRSFNIPAQSPINVIRAIFVIHKVAPAHFRRLSASAAPSHDVSAFGLSTRVTIRVTTGASYEASEGGRTVIYQQWWW